MIVQTADAFWESSPVSFLLISFSRSLIRQEKMWNVCIKIVLVEVNDTKTPLRQVSPLSGHFGSHLLEWDQNLQSCLSIFANHQKKVDWLLYLKHGTSIPTVC